MTKARDNATQGGLVLITKQDFATATSVSLNNVFTSTYDNYRILFSGYGAANSQEIYGRLRASGSNLTTGYNGGTDGTDPTNGGSSTRYKRVETTAMALGYISVSGDARNFWSFDINGPTLLNYKTWTGTFISQNSGVYNYMGVMGGYINSNTSYDGFTIYSGSNMTLSVSVYGYKKN